MIRPWAVIFAVTDLRFNNLVLPLWAGQRWKPLSKTSWCIVPVCWWVWNSTSPWSSVPGPPKWRMFCPWEGMEIPESHHTVSGRNREALRISPFLEPAALCLSVQPKQTELCKETWAAELDISFCLCNYKWHCFSDRSTQLSNNCLQMLLSF